MIPISSTCDSCGRTLAGDEVHDLAPAGPGPGADPPRPLRLCDRCLEERTAETWAAKKEPRDRISEALKDRASASKGRFSYLADEEDNLHLVRLREAWMQQVTSRD